MGMFSLSTINQVVRLVLGSFTMEFSLCNKFTLYLKSVESFHLRKSHNCRPGIHTYNLSYRHNIFRYFATLSVVDVVVCRKCCTMCMTKMINGPLQSPPITLLRQQTSLTTGIRTTTSSWIVSTLQT